MLAMNNFILTEETSKAESPSNIGIYVPSQETEVVCATVNDDQTAFIGSTVESYNKLKKKKVFFHRGHGLEVRHKGKKYIAVKIDDIICCCE